MASQSRQHNVFSCYICDSKMRPRPGQSETIRIGKEGQQQDKPFDSSHFVNFLLYSPIRYYDQFVKGILDLIYMQGGGIQLNSEEPFELQICEICLNMTKQFVENHLNFYQSQFHLVSELRKRTGAGLDLENDKDWKNILCVVEEETNHNHIQMKDMKSFEHQFKAFYEKLTIFGYGLETERAYETFWILKRFEAFKKADNVVDNGESDESRDYITKEIEAGQQQPQVCGPVLDGDGGGVQGIDQPIMQLANDESVDEKIERLETESFQRKSSQISNKRKRSVGSGISNVMKSSRKQRQRSPPMETTKWGEAVATKLTKKKTEQKIRKHKLSKKGETEGVKVSRKTNSKNVNCIDGGMVLGSHIKHQYNLRSRYKEQKIEDNKRSRLDLPGNDSNMATSSSNSSSDHFKSDPIQKAQRTTVPCTKLGCGKIFINKHGLHIHHAKVHKKETDWRWRNEMSIVRKKFEEIGTFFLRDKL